jgi:4'-phosphopantetheinyl transferase
VAALAANEVEIWVVDNDLSPLIRDILTDAEVVRFEALEPDARAVAVGARATLRVALGSHLGLEAKTVQIVEGDDRKPVVAGRELEFSVSHTDGGAMVAVAAVPVGIDLERVEPIAGEEFDDLVAFVLDAREREELDLLPEDDRLTAYYRVWTRKEAYVKATGEGIAKRPFSEVIVGVVTPLLIEVHGLPEAELAAWSVVDVDAPQGCVASLVVRQREPRVTVRRTSRS